ncbi:helix-turn-helix domain-containing protein [Sphingobacterium alkalisoli]|uniref:Helix-turn-helix domain-containing protein n=1 Tax=Sphingobacterium alkalisoli TaxID=1874115 RepID=A0A4U0H1X2_9SPHI|nr:helix-turn-helix domain-containing protein [Sphingobacterium alkalisoli]TJY65607.1 helix-turn-helix domain-containing protein [Sphingobacterium alkalisoli]GGH19433.1 hypothetical protein GCM10011418_23870 [Sphingobacterium alkalisoli]
MPQKNIFNLWKETISAKPISKDTFKSMHLAVLHQAVQQKQTEQLFLIQFDIQDFVLYESKGYLQSITNLSLPTKDMEILWLGFQFHGKSTFSSGKVTGSDTLFSFISTTDNQCLTLAAEKHWALFLGIFGASKQQLLTELPLLRAQYEQQQNNILKAIPISNSDRQTFESLSKMVFGPFSTIHHIGQLILKTYTNYTQQLIRRIKQDKKEPQIQLYHQAIAFIRENYMDQTLSREKIADALHCSIRSLNRAFEGRPSSVNATILSLRLYKGRALLRDQLELSVEQIALILYFPDAKHFAVQYKKYFHKTPREDRKTIATRKE